MTFVTCPFCDIILADSKIEICKDCKSRLRKIDKVIQEWNKGIKNSVSVEVRINES